MALNASCAFILSSSFIRLPNSRSSSETSSALQVRISAPTPHISTCAPCPSVKSEGECLLRSKSGLAIVGVVEASSQSMIDHFSASSSRRMTFGQRISRWKSGGSQCMTYTISVSSYWLLNYPLAWSASSTHIRASRSSRSPLGGLVIPRGKNCGCIEWRW